MTPLGCRSPVPGPWSLLLGLLRINADELALAAFVLERDDAADLGKERIVAADPDVRARVLLRPALTNEDRAAADELTAEALHAEAFGLRVTAVPRAADTFFVCHGAISFLPTRPRR